LAEEADSQEDLARALGVRGLARCELADTGGIEDLQRALEITKELGNASWITNAYVALAFTSWLTEGPKEAAGLYDEAIELGSRRGVTGDSMWGRGESVWPLYDLGNWDEVLRRTDEVVAWEGDDASVQSRSVASPRRYCFCEPAS
jgi:hypothetical protein